jgi:hypothetical protein|tara:strand:+ start:5511 stop:5729 length:219 start_codon:yes stop_codon:yes gene_type:complete
MWADDSQRLLRAINWMKNTREEIALLGQLLRERKTYRAMVSVLLSRQHDNEKTIKSLRETNRSIRQARREGR